MPPVDSAPPNSLGPVKAKNPLARRNNATETIRVTRGRLSIVVYLPGSYLGLFRTATRLVGLLIFSAPLTNTDHYQNMGHINHVSMIK